jgi:hypothetical protein
VDEPDSSTFNLFFADQPATRYVNSYIMLPTNLANGPFIIPANSVKEFHGTYKLPFDVSLLGIAPHCHKLGRNWRVFAVTPQNDTIPLIHIDDWDFNWQGAYHFKKLQKLPKNTVIHAYATYDNTANNPLNPNNPPKLTTWGERTSDEMYYLPLLWLPYKNGDENLVLDGNVSATNSPFHFSQTKLYPVTPNPVQGMAKIGFTLAETGAVNVQVWNLQGQLIQNLATYEQVMAGEHILDWDASNLASGLYCITLRANGVVQTQKVVVP